MKLPDIENACIRPEKITQYLLSNNHPDGQHKARFFYSFGFSLATWQKLKIALLQHAFQHEIAQIRTTPFGTSYTIEGHLQAPDGRFPEIRSVWFIETGQITPYFVTAYPLKMP